jgi:hypothetical protein
MYHNTLPLLSWSECVFNPPFRPVSAHAHLSLSLSLSLSHPPPLAFSKDGHVVVLFRRRRHQSYNCPLQTMVKEVWFVSEVWEKVNCFPEIGAKEIDNC